MQNTTRFQKGRKKTGGRKVGVPNKTSNLMKEAILLAAEQVGFDGAGKDGLVGYFMRVAIADQRSFLKLLARLLPIEEAQRRLKTHPFYLSDEEILQEVMRRRLPIDVIIDALGGPATLAEGSEDNTARRPH